MPPAAIESIETPEVMALKWRKRSDSAMPCGAKEGWIESRGGDPSATESHSERGRLAYAPTLREYRCTSVRQRTLAQGALAA